MSRSLRAAIYTRISRDRDGTALGVTRQEKLCYAIADRLAATVAEVFTDNDVSATSSCVRPAWRRMFEGIADGQFDVVIALDSDRLLRKPGDLEQLFELCEKHQVRVCYEHGGFDPVAGDGMMEARIRAAVDAEEVAKLKKLRAAWVVHAPVGFVVAPPRCTRRVPISMKNSTWKRRSVAVSTHAKSVARMPFAWDRMNCAQVGPVRPGAGSIPAARRIVQTVDAAIRWPMRHSSPCTRR